MRHAPTLTLAAILLAFLSLELGPFDQAFIFHGDHERDLRYATLLVQHGHWPESTPSISPTPFELGPALYLILAPAVAISPDPFFVRGYLLGLFAAGVAILFLVLRRFVAWEAAAAAIFGLVSSTFSYEASRQLWHSSLLILPTALFLRAAAGMLEPAKDAPHLIRDGALAAAFAALCLQLHMAAATLVIVLLGAALLSAKRLKRRGLLIGLGAFLLALTPFLWTLARTVWRHTSAPSALGSSVSTGSALAHWSPANPFGFFVANVHTIWGDHLGPLLTWPTVALIAAGAALAIARRRPFGLFLVALLLTGFVVESLLLGNQRAHRYMHANLVPAFALAAFGLDPILARWRPLRWVLLAVGLLVTLEAWLSPIPHAGGRGWLSAKEQRAVAQIVAEHFPLSESDMERRVHGLYFGPTMGLGHLHSLYRLDTAQAHPFSPTAHVAVLPSDLPLAPFGPQIGPAYTIKSPDRQIRIAAYQPGFDTSRLERPPSLQHRWRRPRQPRPQGRHQTRLTVPITRDGLLNVAFSGGRGPRCVLQAHLNNQPIAPTIVAAPAYRGIQFAQLPVHPGTLTLDLAGCDPTSLDIF